MTSLYKYPKIDVSAKKWIKWPHPTQFLAGENKKTDKFSETPLEPFISRNLWPNGQTPQNTRLGCFIISILTFLRGVCHFVPPAVARTVVNTRACSTVPFPTSFVQPHRQSHRCTHSCPTKRDSLSRCRGHFGSNVSGVSVTSLESRSTRAKSYPPQPCHELWSACCPQHRYGVHIALQFCAQTNLCDSFLSPQMRLLCWSEARGRLLVSLTCLPSTFQDHFRFAAQPLSPALASHRTLTSCCLQTRESSSPVSRHKIVATFRRRVRRVLRCSPLSPTVYKCHGKNVPVIKFGRAATVAQYTTWTARTDVKPILCEFKVSNFGLLVFWSYKQDKSIPECPEHKQKAW